MNPDAAASNPGNHWALRHGLLVTGISPIASQLVGSIFNIWYNHEQIRPMLTEDQLQRFLATVAVFNIIVYPLFSCIWLSLPFSLRRIHRELRAGHSVADRRLVSAQRRVVNMPWWFAMVAGMAWMACVPTFPLAIASSPDPVKPFVNVHLVTSFVIGGAIAVTHGLFFAEWATQRLLYPVFFRSGPPDELRRAIRVNLSARGLVWSLAAVICPVSSILLLQLAPVSPTNRTGFVLFVGISSVIFSVATGLLLGRWIVEPVWRLRDASRQVGKGNLNATVDLIRLDEFGTLIQEFNKMVLGLREKEHVRRMFGLHVGEQAARHILQHDPDLAGKERFVAVMFADIRNFTQRSSECSPQEIVWLLNQFLTCAVDVVERNQGMVNKFLGDGFMAVFGAGPADDGAAAAAVNAARELVQQTQQLNFQLKLTGDARLAIGVGLHFGPAVVGSIGSRSRKDFTVIGDTVNVASRIESLTKTVGQSVLASENLVSAAGRPELFRFVASQLVKGKTAPIELYTLCDGQPDGAQSPAAADDAND